VWHCVIFIRSGLYKDGKFKFTMEFLKDFPSTRPIIQFQQLIYHPLINPNNNLLDMNVIFRKEIIHKFICKKVFVSELEIWHSFDFHDFFRNQEYFH